MDKSLLFFILEKDNKYSVSVLIAAIESFGLTKHYDIITAPLTKAIEVLPILAHRYKLKVLAYPLLTTHLVDSLNEIKKLINIAHKYSFITIAGGPHPTGDPYGTVLSLGFNYAFRGEGEFWFCEFLRRLVNKGDVGNIRGLCYLDEGNLKLNDRASIDNLNKYPPYPQNFRLLCPIEITRGCPYGCKFCQVSYIFGRVPKHRDIDIIVKYAKELLRRGIRDIRFITPNSFGYGKSRNDIINLIDALQIIRREGGRLFLGTFPSEVRPEYVCEDVVRNLRGKIDNKRIIIGAQSGSNRVLKLLNRGHTVEDVDEAISILSRYGFSVDIDYIFGLPFEEDEDIELTLKHIEKVISLGARIHAHVFMPLPGTPLEFAPPGTIDVRVRKFILKLIGKGYVYGYWEKQEIIAREISRLRSEGIIILSRSRAEAILRSKFRR